MNSSVHPVVVVLVLLTACLSIGIWAWGSGEASSIGGPAELRMGPNGHLYIQIQNQLLEHDREGAFLKRHDLARLGVENVLGTFAFFANGDVLVRRGPDPRSLFDNIRAYRRQTNEHSLVPLTPDTGLYRCILELATCSVFGSEGIDFKAAHSIFIDWRTDDVFISDTTRHLLRKYSSNGDVAAAPVAGFRFPNQLLLHEEKLFVANTNHHQINIVSSGTESFGRELDVIDVVPREASTAGQTWPTHIARIGEEWWVNNMRSDMNEGGIYIFDDSWQFDRKVALPPGADPISLLPFRGEVLISDWNNDRIHRVSMEGRPLPDFVSSGLVQVLTESRAKRRGFEVYRYAGIVLFVLVILGLFVRGLAAGMSAEPAT